MASVICLTGAIFGYVFLEEVSSPHSFPSSVLTFIVDFAQQTSRVSQVDHRGSPGTKVGAIYFSDAYLRAHYTCPLLVWSWAQFHIYGL